jgi:hypothetical protein
MKSTGISQSSNPAYRQAFERLDEALEENTPSNNYEKIRLMRQAMFADVEEFVKTHPIILPKP